MTDPSLLAHLDQSEAAERETGIRLIKILLMAYHAKGRTDLETATEIYDEFLGPMIRANTNVVLAVRESLEPHPAALADVARAIEALDPPDVTP